MSANRMWRIAGTLTAIAMLVAACGTPATAAPTQPPATEVSAATAAPATEAPPQEFVFGMLLVGPYNDHGWSQAHYDGGQYVEEKVPGAR